MKKLLLAIMTIGAMFGLSAQTLTELYVPQFFGGRTSGSANNARIPIMALVQITGLTPSTSYDLRVNMALTSEANTAYGAGNQWNGTSFGTANWANAFTTDANGNSGPVWVYVQPTGNSTGGRFLPGSAHNLRYGIAPNGTSIPSTPSFVGAKSITALDLGTTALTSATTDDGAYIIGTADASASGKFVLAYSNIAGTGDPIGIYRVRSHSINQPTNSELPTSVNDILMGTINTDGVYAMLIPIGANNSNGIRRLETRNADGTLFSSSTDADGIWTGGANTTTVARRGVETILATDAPLPVQFKSFTATKGNDVVNLKWSTASESNNKGFEVQRSVNGAKYQTVGFVKGNGNSNVVKTYSFTDAHGTTGNICYRLKQIDFNGASEFSKVACVSVVLEKTTAVFTTPNPFSGSLHLKYNSVTEGTANVQIIDMLGKSHQNINMFVNKGENTLTLDTEALPVGIYFIRVTNGAEVTTQRIVKK